MATDSPKPMSPTAAVARHVEWLEFALAAARDEEVRRQGRLDRATDKNRSKRSTRLAEVSAEVGELAALVKGLKDLQAPRVAPVRKPRATTRSSAGTGRRAPGTTTRAASGAAAASTVSPKASPASKASPATTASKTPKAPTPKKRAASGSKPAGTRARRSRATAKTSAASPRAAATTAPTGPTV